jgi:hypothetical protein
LNASQTVRKFCFCKSMRFLMNFMNEFERSCDACHVLNSYAMIDLTIIVYTYLVFSRLLTSMQWDVWARAFALSFFHKFSWHVNFT